MTINVRTQAFRRCVLRCGAIAFAVASTAVHAELPYEARRERIAAMSRRIDEHINAKLQENGAEPAPLCSNSEFLRRVSLDIRGVIPTVAEVRAHLDAAESQADPQWRIDWIDQCLESPRYATHLSITWRRMMVPRDANFAAQLPQATGLQQWLRDQFAANIRYDRLVADFIASTGDERTGPALFYRVLEAKPEKLAAATSQLFLGLRIQCAECHDHPFDEWTQNDFWGYAAFFAQLESDSMMNRGSFRLVDRSEGDVTLPDTEEVVAPKYPTDTDPSALRIGTRRRQLAIWMASRDNPYLAPAAVNRVWGHLFGRGIVHPVDDMGPHNPASHPELLHELAEFFVAEQFDIPTLMRAILGSETYQRTSRSSSTSPDPAMFATMAVKRVSAEQLYDSLQQSLGLATGAVTPEDPRRREFLLKMESNSDAADVYDLGMQQALLMMNGERTASSESHQILTALEAPFIDARQRIEILFLATLSRYPTAAEAERMSAYLQLVDSPRDACGDILWALVNSAEYQFNH